jgi:hypothetical protein
VPVSSARGCLGGDDKIERAVNTWVGAADWGIALTTRAAVAIEPGSSPPLSGKSIDIGVPGYELFFCNVGGVPIEFMGGYSDNIDRSLNDATNS